MRKEQVIITPLRITKGLQNKHFQVKLPKTAKKIIGIELGGFWMGARGDGGVIFIGSPGGAAVYPADSFKLEAAMFAASRDLKGVQFFRRNILIGELKLQSCEEANIFYAGHLQMDNNLSQGDFTQTPFWTPQPFTHEIKSFEEHIIVDADSTVISGLYRDRIGEITKANIDYLVNLYVWIEVENNEPKTEAK